ncbi:Uncharacterised protein [Mycolicibacterium phlei]|uniref:DUF4192 domain-containing protein n=1 Tax=Mycolicibacterium phlei DSM 43239 = CCUG 21000 TaxID=1226750 RepID=A0A5N5V9T5_MYCPH|nr:DUF4192 domain-containing protein [Mycolicibacterium phlei]VEG10031.1 Uncharacterised protein [Mycobacteroides chelonae]AMO61925.1 hypothetical protein MPHLCCUG_03120 [Mycolicibacterium phlei]KAB7758496.1 hypothetical protein MPHL21000_05730 [Mycolicibacterium phlei DSM 43239 = CCUG 21000]KXW66996.1 hypothetical protein MPHL43239_06905 [Mycolicibacterium phlei DSM 43239 = CCUG 21000]KXW70546.1 hypothetical protein MPHL43072_19010 [Mycolicibacterium phlei DSM 43072]
MTTSQPPDFHLNRPAALIAALPALLGFVPEDSLVLVTVERGALGCVMRIDLDLALQGSFDDLAELTAVAGPDAAIAVIVDETAWDCPSCADDYRDLVDTLTETFAEWGVELLAAHVVDRVAAGGRWRCADGCGMAGTIEDPQASPLAMAAVLDGRRLYARRSDLQQVIAVADTAHAAALAPAIAVHRADRPDADVRADILAALDAAQRVAAGEDLPDETLTALAGALTDVKVRDTLFALAVGECAGQAESLWAEMARRLPDPWRVEALVLLAFSAYARGDGPLAGISLEAALRCDDSHRMASMLDRALHAALRPEQIRELARTGYKLAAQLGVRLPPRRTFGRRAG